MTEQHILLVLRPQPHFGIVGAELKRVGSLGQYMLARGTVIMANVGDDDPEELRQIATLCQELQPSSLYVRYANRKVFRHEKDFWATTDQTVKRHVKQMADQRVVAAVRIAASLGFPILYVPTEKSPLHLSDCLSLSADEEVTPVMHFHRHAGGTTYRLQLRIGERLIDTPSDHRLTVITHTPGMFALDGHIYIMDNSFSGKLLLPFVGKAAVEIPQKLENDYFHRFILQQIARVEIHAEGFDIDDTVIKPQPCLKTGTTISGQQLLTLYFRYGTQEYPSDSKANGRVTLEETADGGFRFCRQLRNKHDERQVYELLSSMAPQLSPRGHIYFPTVAAMVEWLRQHGPRLRAQGFDVVQPSTQLYYIGPLSVEQKDTWQGDWLQTDVTVVVELTSSDDNPEGKRLRIPFRDLRDTILRGEQEYMLPTGERLIIPHEWLERYSDLLLIGPKRHRSQITPIQPRQEEAGHAAATAEAVAGQGGAVTAPRTLRATLRPYQQTGFEWLWGNFTAQTGCCLSDEMGLGKTVQTIALLLNYKETTKDAVPARQPQPGMLFTDEEMTGRGDSSSEGSTSHSLPTMEYRASLVVAPASVIHNWKNELSRFAPSLTVCDYTGVAIKRRSKRLALMRHDIIVTTYRTLLNDISFFAQQQFGIIVFDESQAFKTPTSHIHQAVSRLQAIHRLALSGTPVENNLMELWSLMSVLNPNLLGDSHTFQQAFVNPIARQMEESRTQLLRRLIAPYFLKRTKDQGLSDLPERQDEVVVCPMTAEQSSRYAEELSRARNEWLDPTVAAAHRQINVLAAIQRLRQIANGEGKMGVVFEQLENLRGTGHKVLLFSEYVSLLEHVGTEMEQRGWPYALLTGQTQHREQVIAHFQQTAACQFFLISLKAGGVGLNLTAADYVFLLDPWWNQAAEEQAIARSHRIGQRRAVFVYRFVAADTLEEQILTLQERKQTLIDSVMPFICDGAADK